MSVALFLSKKEAEIVRDLLEGEIVMMEDVKENRDKLKSVCKMYCDITDQIEHIEEEEEEVAKEFEIKLPDVETEVA